MSDSNLVSDSNKKSDTPAGAAQSNEQQNIEPRRQVYVRRRGRMTKGQGRALETLREDYCVDASKVAFADVFDNDNDLGIEIGFGMGHATAHWATLRPDMNLLGIEVYEPGIGALLLSLEEQGLENVRVLEGDARVLLEDWVPEGALAQINLFFPDPWPKKRHASRRIVQPDTIELYASRLRPGGTLRIATDWQPYAQWILECGDASDSLQNMAGGYSERAEERPVTNFEARGLRLGHGVWDFWYQRQQQ